MEVSRQEYDVLRLASDWRRIDEIAAALGVKVDSLSRVVEGLKARGLLEVRRVEEDYYELSEEGTKYLADGLPELRLLRSAKCEAGKCVVRVEGSEAGIALANLAKLGIRPRGGVIEIGEDEYRRVLSQVEAKQEALARLARGEQVDRQVLEEFIRRRIVERRRRTAILVKSRIDASMLKPVEYVSALTGEMIRSGSWRLVKLKPIDLSIEVPPAPFPKPHFLWEFIELARRIMIGLGFEEARGPIVEWEFWNFDALFQAQDHPAREIHDTFFVESPWRPQEPPRDLIERVGAVHLNGGGTGSRGWGKWSLDKALGLVLRTQMTAVSVRELARRGDGEYRVFAIGRVFRPEHLDPKHSMEFHQLDGIVVGASLSFKHLLGILREVMRRFGFEDVRFRPAYFPFTSPSVEVYAKHETLGWIEVAGAGIFRPEVVKPLGITRSTVLAFGIGLDRLAMSLLGISDIRELHAEDENTITKYLARLAELRARLSATYG